MWLPVCLSFNENSLPGAPARIFHSRRLIVPFFGFMLSEGNTMDVPIRIISLENSLTIRIHDGTRRYYGDFYLVKLEIVCEVPLLSEFFATEADLTLAKKLLGDKVVYRRIVERMGVPSSEVESAKNILLQNFERNSLSYFKTEDFPRKIVISEFTRARKKLRLTAA